jgi:hypothetical protein
VNHLEVVVGKLDLEPDDVLVIRCLVHVGPEQIERLQAQATAIVGADRKVMVLGRDMELTKISGGHDG